VSDVDFKVYVGERKTEVFHYKHHADANRLKDEPRVHKVDSKKKKKKDKKKNKDGSKEGAEANGKEPDVENGDHDEQQETAEFDCGAGVPVFGDVKMDFSKDGARIFMFWFNTFFVKDLHVVIEKTGLDKANKDAKHNKLYEKDFKVELVFSEVIATPSTPSTPTTPTPIILAIPAPPTTPMASDSNGHH
jgi:hypothetical protein